MGTDLADLEQPAFSCSTAVGEVYTIPLVQLLKLCGCYKAPVAAVTATKPPSRGVMTVGKSSQH